MGIDSAHSAELYVTESMCMSRNAHDGYGWPNNLSTRSHLKVVADWLQWVWAYHAHQLLRYAQRLCTNLQELNMRLHCWRLAQGCVPQDQQS